MTSTARQTSQADTTPRAPRPLGWGIALILVGALWLATSLGVDVPADALLAPALVIVGLVVLVGGRYGIGEAFVGIGIVLLVLAVLSPFGRGPMVAAGEVTERPTSVDDLDENYALGAGRLELDLRDVTFPTSTEIVVRIGAGEILVIVPDGVGVAGDARLAVGEVRALDRVSSGIAPAVEIRSAPSSGSATVTLVLRGGVGKVEVRQ
ncbi:MAG: LiaF domain-containing protein [Nitriliruptoraceae bacterium]